MTEPPSFYLDENVEIAVSEGARRRGVNVTTARDQGRLGLDDADQMAWASERGLVLVTHDRGFERRHWAGEPHAGLVYFARGISIGTMVEWLALMAGVFTADEMLNHFQPAG